MNRAEHMLAARFAIEDILFRFAEAIDEGDLENAVALIGDGFILMPDGTRLAGGAGLLESYRQLLIFYDADGQPSSYRRGVTKPRTRHLLTNLIFEFDDEISRARVRCCFTVYQTLTGKNTIVAGGRYADLFQRELDQWQLVQREVHMDHAGNLAGHLRI